MTRYYFHLQGEDGASLDDEEGIEFDTSEAARNHAVAIARGILSDEIRNTGELDLNSSLVVIDCQGRERAIVPFRETIRIRLRN